ncbi:unnamed protein product, partial [Didymodactylos carnosus]
YMGHRSQNEFIQIIGEEIQRLNLNQIRQGTYYSIMTDSTPDSNRQDTFTLVIRFVNDQLIPEERFVSIKELHAKTGDGLANHILEVLNELDLNPEHLIAQSYDFAGNMSGRFNGVQAKISEKLQKDIIYTPCSAHRSNTELKHAYDIIDDKAFDQETHKEGISIVKDMKTFNFICYLIFMKNAVSMTNALTTEFQRTELDMITAAEILSGTINVLQCERDDDNTLKNIITVADNWSKSYDINPDEEFNKHHRPRRPPRRIDQNPSTAHVFTR